MRVFALGKTLKILLLLFDVFLNFQIVEQHVRYIFQAKLTVVLLNSIGIHSYSTKSPKRIAENVSVFSFSTFDVCSSPVQFSCRNFVPVPCASLSDCFLRSRDIFLCCFLLLLSVPSTHPTFCLFNESFSLFVICCFLCFLPAY